MQYGSSYSYCAKLEQMWKSLWSFEGCNIVLLPNLNHSDSKSHVSKKQKNSLRKTAKILKLFSFCFKPEHLSLMYKCYVCKKEKKQHEWYFYDVVVSVLELIAEVDLVTFLERKGKTIPQSLTNTDVPVQGSPVSVQFVVVHLLVCSLECKRNDSSGLAVPVSIC